jgi:transposase-like protein
VVHAPPDQARHARGTLEKTSGEVEVDETFVAGKVGFMKRDARERRGITRRGGLGEHTTAVMGFRERESGRVHAQVIPDAKGGTLKPAVHATVRAGSAVYTDQWNGYTGLESRFDHQTVNHAETYVDCRVHTNGIESFWAMVKRGLNGTYVSVEPFQLFRYLDERVFTYNEHDLTDLGRFSAVLGAISDRRLTYAALTAST